MRILQVHERYLQHGGEDVEAEAEKLLLRDNGHTVIEYARDNSEIGGYGAWRWTTLGPRTVWAWDSYRKMKSLLREHKPDIVHFHNTFPLVSPSCYYACREAGVTVVQALQNYRLLCPSGNFYRNGHLCEDCLGKNLPWPGVAHACYRRSHAASLAVAAMLGVHNGLNTWARMVDHFVAPTEFARRKFIEGGLPGERIAVKPNLVFPDPMDTFEKVQPNGGPEVPRSAAEPGYGLFVGRLVPEKGVRTLLAAWRQVSGNAWLRIAGDGPLRGEVEAAARGANRVFCEGLKTRPEVLEAIKGARFLLFPSEWYETFGLVVVEAFACGTPVIAARMGVMEEMIEEGRTGLRFTPGDSLDLARKAEWALNHPSEMEAMGRAARAEYEAKYAADRNYALLMEIYARALRPVGTEGERRRTEISEGTGPEVGAPEPARLATAREATHAVDLAAVSSPFSTARAATVSPSSRQSCIRKVVSVHNFYLQSGGEDVVFAAEKNLLRSHGHEVVEYCDDNHRIEGMNRVALAGTTIWSRKARRDLETVLREEKPDVAHFHNTVPLISPAAYYACRDAGVPVVQTLHNYRLLCPAGNLSRDSRVCEDCLGKSFGWPGIVHGCYRQSRPATSVVATMVATHWALGTWTKLVDVYIAPTEFSRRKFIAGGLPAEKIVVKPNFVDADPGPRSGPGDYALYLGRLSPEKGVGLLVRAWSGLRHNVPLFIAGDGPLRTQLQKEVGDRSLEGLTLLGGLDRGAALSWLRGARFLVAPSECYETFALAVVEAFACGTPVVAARLGPLEEIVEDGKTGLHFAPGDPDDLRRKVEWAWDHPREMEAMGRAARAEYEAKYTAERNYQLLTEIYERATGSPSVAARRTSAAQAMR